MSLCALYSHKPRGVVFPGPHHDASSKQRVSQPQNRPRDGDAVRVDDASRGAKAKVEVPA